jgi:surface polysaccharide O-acyltransferase-like enzyme
MSIDQTSSERFALLRFPLIVGVILLHTYATEKLITANAENLFQPSYLILLIKNLISENFSRISVPLFFLISGYLYSSNFSYTWANYLIKLKSRIKSLLLPFLFWNNLVFVIFYLAQNNSITGEYFSGQYTSVSSYNIWGYLNAIIGFTRNPIAYQFWFIRDLMVCVLLTPVWYFFIKYVPLAFGVILLIFWFIGINIFYFPAISSVAFFYFGLVLSVFKVKSSKVDGYGKIISLSYLVTLILKVFLLGTIYDNFIGKISIVLGIAVALYLSGFIAKSAISRRLFLYLSSFSFFIFAMHEPLLWGFQKVIYRIHPPDSDFQILLLYFLAPTLVIFSGIVGYITLNKIAPKFLRIISGGR